MAEKNSAADPVRSQDVRSVKTKQDRGEPVTHTAAAEDGNEPETEQEEQEQSEDKR